MSQTKFNKLTIKQRHDSSTQLSTGANTEIYLDDKPLKGVQFLKLEFKACKTTKILLEMVAEVDKIEGYYELGSYFPHEPEDNFLKIKAALLKGGLVHADRCTGKTRAIAEILLEDPNAIAVCALTNQRSQLLNYMGVTPDRVFINSKRIYDKLVGKKVFVDEYDPSKQYPEFFAAVTSKVSVIS